VTEEENGVRWFEGGDKRGGVGETECVEMEDKGGMRRGEC
jgi:hypothetical protein